MARHASLAATLRRVRVRRRVRKTMRLTAVVALLAVPLWLMRPHSPGPDNAVAQNPLVIHTRPLTPAQTVRSSATPGIRVRSETGITARVTTPSDALVPRLGEAEFHQLLAAHEVGYVQVAGIPARVLPLHGVDP